MAVNRELILLYWHIGRDILDRQSRAGWGAKVIERLAADLHSEFPDIKGFSRTNLLYMRAFAEAWPEESFVQQVVGQIPWGHNLRVLDLVKDLRQREWYVRAALQHGWSRNVLIHQIESGLHRRLGRHKRTSPRPCRRPNRISPSRSSRTLTILIFSHCQRTPERRNWNPVSWNIFGDSSSNWVSASPSSAANTPSKWEARISGSICFSTISNCTALWSSTLRWDRSSRSTQGR